MRRQMTGWRGWAFVGACVVVVASVLSLVLVKTPVGNHIVSNPPAPSPSQAGPAPKKVAAPGVSQVGDQVYYTVQPFDIGKREGTLTFIAQRFHTTVGQLVKWNDIKDPDHIGVHQRLRVR